MTKAILLSVRSEHVYNILNGDKTLELRKSVPKGFKGLVYVYCTKAKPLMFLDVNKEDFVLCNDNTNITYFDADYQREIGAELLNGKVVARFWFDEYDEIEYETIDDYSGALEDVCMNDNHYEIIVGQSCLDYEMMKEYANYKNLYAWHIKNLEIFDKPMELSEFYSDYDVFDTNQYGKYIGEYEIGINPLTKAPQSWQYVYVKEKNNE